MPLSTFAGVKLSAVSAVVPPQSISVEDELEFYGGSLEQAKRVTEVSGLHTRRVAAPGVTAADLCAQAAENLLRDHNVDRSEIDALIFVTHSPDYLLPASATILQHRLGLSAECATMDVNVGCAGFVKGLWLGAGLIASGACRRFLLLTGDTPNRFQDRANRVIAPVFGDAGTAALLEKDDSGESMSFLLGSNGGKFEVLAIPGGGSRLPHEMHESPDSPLNRIIKDTHGNPWSLGGYCKIWMNGMAVYSFTMSVVPAHIRRHLQEAGLEPGDLDCLLLHQANRLVVEGIAKKLHVSQDKTPYGALGKYGNLGASSLPAQLCETISSAGARGRMPEKSLLCGFGAGLAWGSCVLSLKACRAQPVAEYHDDGAGAGRDALIEAWHERFRKA